MKGCLEPRASVVEGDLDAGDGASTARVRVSFDFVALGVERDVLVVRG